jgi:hypothetical protein
LRFIARFAIARSASFKRRHDRQATNEFGYQSVADQILRLNLVQQLADALLLFAGFHIGHEADATLRRAVHNDLFETGKCAAADEQNIAGIDLQELLLRMLPATLWRHRGDRAFAPDTSRVIDGLSDLREILSISSM